MTNRTPVLLVMFVAFFVSVLSAEECTGKTDLVETIGAFYAAIEAGDAEARIEILADDVILMPNHWTMMQGKDAVSASFRRSASSIFNIKDRQIVEMDVSDNLAYTVNSYYYTYHGKEEPEQWHKTKNVHIWHKNAAGAWKLAVDIWNSDVPLD